MTAPVAVAKVGIGTPDAAAAINAYDPDLHATTTGDGSALTIRVVVDRRQQRGLPRGWARPTCERQRDRQPTPEREATRMHSVRAHGPRRARHDRTPGGQRRRGPLRPPHRHGGRRQEDHTSLNGMPHRRAVPGQVRAAERANPDGGVRLMPSKWVLVSKYKADGSFNRTKGRLVACEAASRYYVPDTWSPTVGLSSVRLLLDIAAAHGAHILTLECFRSLFFFLKASLAPPGRKFSPGYPRASTW